MSHGAVESEAHYFAFLSYSHRDEGWARWLHRSLERYRVPKRLVGRQTPAGVVPERLFPVFRDREELASAHELGPAIEGALRVSRNLLVICSPAAAQSRWVNEEIRRFKMLGRAERIFCLIVDGEPGEPGRECFPSALRQSLDAQGAVGTEAVEPIAADARPQGDGKADARLKLIAGALGLGFDELKQRDLAARNRRLRLVAAAAMVFAGVTLGLALIASQARNEAERQRAVAESRQQQAEALIQFMLGDLREKLEPLGKLEILDAVGAQALDYFATVDPAQLSDRELSARATALRQIGAVRVEQGQLDRAAEVFRAAVKLDGEIHARSGTNTEALFNLAQSVFYVGYDHYQRAEYSEARPWWQRYAEYSDRLVELEPEEPRWRAEVQYAEVNLGALEFQLGRFELALAHFELACEQARQFYEADPTDPVRAKELSTALTWAGKTLVQLGRGEAALAVYGEQFDLARRTHSYDDSVPRAAKLLKYGLNYAAAALRLDRTAVAQQVLEELHPAQQFVIDTDPENQSWRQTQADFAELQAAADLQMQRSAAAVEPLRKLFQQARAAAEAEEGIAWRKRATRLARRLAEAWQALGQAPAVDEAIAQGFELWRSGGEWRFANDGVVEEFCVVAARLRPAHPALGACPNFAPAVSAGTAHAGP